MAITGENIHSFSYIELLNNDYPHQIKDYLTSRLLKAESKHVASLSDKTKVFFDLSNKVGYKNTILGIHRQTTIQKDYSRIINMSEAYCMRAIRFVISKDERIWSDNTHWTLAYILKFGESVKIIDTPSYIIDFRGNIPTLYDKDGNVFDGLADIKSAIASARRIQERLDIGWRPINLSYTIADLSKDLSHLNFNAKGE